MKRHVGERILCVFFGIYNLLKQGGRNGLEMVEHIGFYAVRFAVSIQSELST
jgi:hypothetical protein